MAPARGASASSSQQLPNVVDQLGDMRDEIRVLQAQVRQLQAAAPSSADRAGEAEAPAASQGLYRPSDGSRWSDQLDEDDMITDHGASRGAVVTSDGEAQMDADGKLAAAARRLDESRNEVIQLNVRRRSKTDVQVRKLTLASRELLSALGFRHASADAADGEKLEELDGQEDGASADCADGELVAVGRNEGTAACAASLRDDREGDIDAAAMTDVADKLHSAQSAPERHSTEAPGCGGAPEHTAPGAYIGWPLEADQLMSSDNLEQLIAEAQAEDARHCAEASWPLRLPAFWYRQDPKRASRALFVMRTGAMPRGTK